MSRTRTIVITGAAGGIGSEIVDRFLTNGDTVVAADVSQDALGTWRTRWDSIEFRPALHALAVDISSEDSVAAFVERVQEQLGAVDVLINCAGYFPQTAFEAMTSQSGAELSTSTSPATST